MKKVRRTRQKTKLSSKQIVDSLSGLNEPQLLSVFNATKQQILKIKEAYAAKAREFEALIRGGTESLSKRVTGLSDGKALRKRGIRKFPPKYRNPDNPQQTWAGQGIRPKWMPGYPKELDEETLALYRI
jgi:DNA-binding protein H-NS